MSKWEVNEMETLLVRDLMVPAERFPRVSAQARFYDALEALEIAQKKYLSGESEQRILLVEDENRKVIGKLSPFDLLRGLETNYSRVDAEQVLSRFGLSRVWQSIREEYHLWESPFRDLCRKAEKIRVMDFVKGPSEGQSVGIADTMAKCFHLFVMGRHDALFVVKDAEILGLLRFSDVYRKVSETMKACSTQAIQ